MYVLTSIRELDTSSEHCVDRCVRDPRHRVSDCVVGLRAGDSWQYGETRMGDSEDMFASTQEEEQEGQQGQEEEEEEGRILLPQNYQVAGRAVWEEHSLMSPWAARPLLVATIKESRDTMVTFFQNFLDPEIHLLTHFFSSPS